MELLKFFFKDDVEAVGISKFMDKKEEYTSYIEQNFNTGRQYFKPDYSNNFFLL